MAAIVALQPVATAQRLRNVGRALQQSLSRSFAGGSATTSSSSSTERTSNHGTERTSTGQEDHGEDEELSLATRAFLGHNKRGGTRRSWTKYERTRAVAPQ
ncbi:unnamed protein product [Amoebophrya sp. A25]|nr:unnamed protein product [Amoebophrya sp. A25]|eukprot:GSA25T00012578001.1